MIWWTKFTSKQTVIEKRPCRSGRIFLLFSYRFSAYTKIASLENGGRRLYSCVN
jgi:hypothetical protein